ncbi:uncharacterized protein TM35_000064550 [Trypanosoma theileri]|uniref:Uncharacterized protein n=1 Tax=Trypanosoma theileri TaxID=67003 RepID=A0A1X0P4T0_9TRYP|nr:uncharacterized protein TM35_000064550 [Trypanosoma theileri]ORC91450.1 hypothetical protein TM35_000064550 [Trypanosoma theileri]
MSVRSFNSSYSFWVKTSQTSSVMWSESLRGFASSNLGKPLVSGEQSSRGKDYTLNPVEMESIYKVSHSSDCVGEVANSYGEDDILNQTVLSSCTNLSFKGSTERSEDKELDKEPLAKNLHNTVGPTPYRVSWYDYDSVSPAKRFTYWAYRRLRELPPEWQEYYRRMLYQELTAARYVNQTWDCFMMVVDGYRKAKWVLKKYGIPIDENLIPKPYNDFWEETTHEERVWAHRRSHQLKELQALQREEDELVFGAQMVDRREVSYGSIKNLQSPMQGGTPVHAHDLPAPYESDIKMSPHDEDMSSALMSSIEDDKLWNPVLRSRLHTQRMREEVELYAFEDDDDDNSVP